MRKIRLTETAEKDLEYIWHYTVSQWGLAQADKYTALIEKRLNQLLENPHLGEARPDIREGYRALPVEKHLIFYRLSADYIDVLGIPHARMDARRHLSKT
jgi:toxin ParE1/3/4